MKLIIIDEDELEPDSEWSEYADGYIAYSSIQIQAAKVADAVPVVHAKWSDGLVCSECKCGIMEYCYEEPISEFPYCPFCGARMDGAE